ncbi:MAG: phosphoribosyltransferase domain-containing protein, partial [Bacillota bacterium]|nr:phosphoribosyltransferase domain-containing protein [Bacillota bacterium]
SSSLNSYYIHTSRENITKIKPSILFCEEHSHASEHMIFPIDPNIFNEYEDIVLIDDELTTGKTSLNLIHHLPVSKTYGIISILDWRNKTNREIYENENSRNILVCSLVDGSIECKKSGEISSYDFSEDYSTSYPAKHKDICFNLPSFLEGFIEASGRFGISSDKTAQINKEIKSLAEILKKERIEGNCLCLGTGEFIYIPDLISCELGEKVFFHSTTRSPIYAMDNDNYIIKNKVSFPSPDGSDINNYLYNIPKNFYNQVFIFSEKTFDNNTKENFDKIFSHFNISNVVFVSWNSDTYTKDVI